jgi:hypothetical protein
VAAAQLDLGSGRGGLRPDRRRAPLNPREIAVAIAGEMALLATALGLIVRGRWRLSWFLALYVPVNLTCEVFITSWPERFWASEFWIVKETIYDALTLGIALELAWRTFHVFPGAESTARKTALLILTGTALAVMVVPMESSRSSPFAVVMGQLHPRVMGGTIWLMAATLALAQ